MEYSGSISLVILLSSTSSEPFCESPALSDAYKAHSADFRSVSFNISRIKCSWAKAPRDLSGKPPMRRSRWFNSSIPVKFEFLHSWRSDDLFNVLISRAIFHTFSSDSPKTLSFEPSWAALSMGSKAPVSSDVAKSSFNFLDPLACLGRCSGGIVTFKNFLIVLELSEFEPCVHVSSFGSSKYFKSGRPQPPIWGSNLAFLWSAGPHPPRISFNISRFET
mmetsp:Transcript_11367/g.17964  ORF Transcript_11367/g.17964 Transcript_11367/m.17964 type:complete len:220 (+) Transcript_11367:125-784(+)